MNALVTGMRAVVVQNTGTPRLAFDVIFYGPPFASSDSRMSSLAVDIAAGDTTAQLAAKINTAIDTEAQRMTATQPGGSVVPVNTLCPQYAKLR